MLIKKISTFLCISIILGLLMATAVNAMSINIRLADDIKNNANQIGFKYNFYYTQDGIVEQNMSSNMSGISLKDIPQFFDIFNQMVSDITPINSILGNHSEISLSYTTNDGTEVSPRSCKNISAQSVMNIAFSEAGCIVN